MAAFDRGVWLGHRPGLGAVVSRTVMTWVAVLELPQLSVAVQVRVRV